MGKIKTSFISTVYNEEKTIQLFLDSIYSQTKKPGEIIITDGGSTDNTQKIINTYFTENKTIPATLLIKIGNRAIGRNSAIDKAKGDIILCSDAGNILSIHWIKNILEPFCDSSVDVVAGYYLINSKSIFAKAIASYIFIMPDKVNPNHFLPATRSMAFTKLSWEKVERFPEEFSHNEDYVFANRLKKIKARIVFQKNAVVYWIPPQSVKKIWVMFYRFALGDLEARIIRPKVVLLFLRYTVGILLIFIAILSHNNYLMFSIIGLFLLYLTWAILKNYKYVRSWKAVYLLPFLQIYSDTAVLIGSTRGFLFRKKV